MQVAPPISGGRPAHLAAGNTVPPAILLIYHEEKDVDEGKGPHRCEEHDSGSKEGEGGGLAALEQLPALGEQEDQDGN